MRHYDDVRKLLAAEGAELGTTEWRRIGTKATFGITVAVARDDKSACVAEDTIVWLA